MKAAGEDKIRAAYGNTDKQERVAAVAAAQAKRSSRALSEEQQADENLGSALKKLESAVVRGDVVKTGKRIDGRALDQVRPIVSEVGVLPRTHGSVAVHPRRDARPRGDHTRYRRRRADDRRADRHVQVELHVALQLPALLGG